MRFVAMAQILIGLMILTPGFAAEGNFLASCEAVMPQGAMNSYLVQIRSLVNASPADKKIAVTVFESFLDGQPRSASPLTAKGLVLQETGIDIEFHGGSIHGDQFLWKNQTLGLQCRLAIVTEFVPKKKISCAPGYFAESFYLEVVDIEPSEVLKIEALEGVSFVLMSLSKPEEFSEPERVRGLRLDVCMDFIDKTVLKRVLFGSGMLRVYDEKNAVFKTTKDLNKAIGGDSEGLLIEIEEIGPFARPGAGLRILGVKKPQGAVLAYPTFIEKGVEGYFGGSLEVGDPFAGPCVKGTLGAWEKQVGTATLSASVCWLQGAGNSAVYHFLSLSVMDINPKIPAAFRGKSVAIPSERLSQFFKHHESHHNWCDRFFLTVPQTGVQYIVAPNPKQTENYPQFGTAVNYGSGWEVLIPAVVGDNPCYGDEVGP